METPEEKSQYERRYHLQRALKPVLTIDSHKRTIYLPEGMDLSKTDQKRVDALVNEYHYVIQATLPIDRYERIVLNGSKGLKGKNIQFRKEMFFSLKPGNKVDRIGKRSDSSRFGEDKFSKPATYVGTIYLDQEKHYAVQLNEALVPEQDMKYYLLYQASAKEIFRTMYLKNGKYSHIQVFKPEYKVRKETRIPKQGKMNF